MAKEQVNISATQQLREAIPIILQEKFSDGATFEQLWNELFLDKKLVKVMINSKKKKRLGLLQGLTNRIKDNKEENITIIKKEDGKNYYVYFDNSIEKITILTENFIKSIQVIDFKTDSNLTKEKEDIVKKHMSAVEKLTKINNELKTVN